MLNDIFRTYKKLIILMVVLLSVTVFWFYSCHSKNTSADTTVFELSSGKEDVYIYRFETEDLEGTVSFGVNGCIEGEGEIPVTLRVRSQSGNFSGTMKVTLPGQDGKGVSYQAAVSCSGGAYSTVLLSVPDLGTTSYFYYDVSDQFGNAQLFQVISHNDAASYEGKVGRLGVLCSDAEKLSYLSDIVLEQEDGNYSFCLIPFTVQDFPDKLEYLQSLDGLLIDGADTGELSTLQVTMLSSWVRQGGNLMIAGGENGKDSLSGLKDMLRVSADQAENEQIRIGDSDSSEDSITLELCDYSFHENSGWSIADWSDPAAIYTKKDGAGSIMLLRFSLQDEQLRQWTGRDEAAESLFCIFKNQQNRGSGSDSASLWYIKKCLYGFLNSQTPNTFFYGVFLFLYILTIGFVSYHFLRRLKKREYIWFSVPLIALAFTGILIFRSRGMLSNSDSTFSAVRVVDDGGKVDETYLLFQSQEGESRSADLTGEIEAVQPIDYEYRTDTGKKRYAIRTSEDLLVNHTSRGYEINFEADIPGTSRILKLTAREDTEEKDGSSVFQMDLNATDIAVEGTVTNQSEYSFSRVVLIRGSQYVIVKDVKPNEKIQIQSSQIRNWTGYEEENEMFSGDIDSSVTGSLLEYIKQQYVLNNENIDEVVAVGITEDMNIPCFSDDNKLENRITVLLSYSELDMDKDEKLVQNLCVSSLSDDKRYPEMSSGILADSQTEAEFALDSRWTVETLSRGYDSFHGTIHAFNQYTGKYDRILKEPGDRMTEEELHPYLTMKNHIVLVFELSDSEEYGAAPIVTALLRDK